MAFWPSQNSRGTVFASSSALFEGRVALGPAGQSPTSHLFLNEKGARVTENTLGRRLWEFVELMGHSDL